MCITCVIVGFELPFCNVAVNIKPFPYAFLLMQQCRSAATVKPKMTEKIKTKLNVMDILLVLAALNLFIVKQLIYKTFSLKSRSWS